MGDVSFDAVRQSRKERVCATCETAIRKGEPYWHTRGNYDGHWWSECYCLGCKEAHRDAFIYSTLPTDEIEVGAGLYEWYQEEVSWSSDVHQKIKENWNKMKARREEARSAKTESKS